MSYEKTYPFLPTEEQLAQARMLRETLVDPLNEGQKIPLFIQLYLEAKASLPAVVAPGERHVEWTPERTELSENVKRAQLDLNRGLFAAMKSLEMYKGMTGIMFLKDMVLRETGLLEKLKDNERPEYIVFMQNLHNDLSDSTFDVEAYLRETLEEVPHLLNWILLTFTQDEL